MSTLATYSWLYYSALKDKAFSLSRFHTFIFRTISLQLVVVLIEETEIRLGEDLLRSEVYSSWLLVVILKEGMDAMLVILLLCLISCCWWSLLMLWWVDDHLLRVHRLNWRVASFTLPIQLLLLFSMSTLNRGHHRILMRNARKTIRTPVFACSWMQFNKRVESSSLGHIRWMLLQCTRYHSLVEALVVFVLVPILL